MIDLQIILTYLTLISIPIGVFYHIITLNNTRKNQQLQLETRQAQLYMGLLNTFRTPEFQTQFHIAESATWEDLEDYREKYSPYSNTEVLSAVTSMFVFFDNVSSLVMKNLIDIDLVDGLLAIALIMIWRRFEPILMDDRDFFQAPNMWDEFEYVYREIIKKDHYSSIRLPYISEPFNP